MSTYPKRSPLEAIRVFCIECQGGSFQGVIECADTACAFYPYRHGTALEKGRHSPVKACKAYCSENCLAGAGYEAVKDCGGDTALLGPCPVFPFRMGTNPNISAESRAKARQRALETDPLGLRSAKKIQAHSAFDAPESTGSPRAEL
jgi:hypothetical protein